MTTVVLPKETTPIVVNPIDFYSKHRNPWCDRDDNNDYEHYADEVEGFDSEEEREGWQDIAEHFAEQ